MVEIIKKILLGLVVLIAVGSVYLTQKMAVALDELPEGSEAISHEEWTKLLQIYVNEKGLVDYEGLLNEQTSLNAYLSLLSTHPPDNNSWTKAEQKAYWINAYNAFTVKLIIDNYPVESIQQLHPTIQLPLASTVWHKKFFVIGGVDFNLHTIEHGILRKQFDDPRIHFALNCASMSCPKLRDEAYEAEQFDAQLDDQARYFINTSGKNKLATHSPKLSSVFDWYEGDFTKNQSLIEYINQYAVTKIDEGATIAYLPYDWSLNEQ